MKRQAKTEGVWKHKKYNDDWVLSKLRKSVTSFILTTPKEVGIKESKLKLLSLPGASTIVIVDEEPQESIDFYFCTSLDFKTLYKELRGMFNIDSSAPVRARKKGKTVYQYSLDGKFIAEYPTGVAAAKATGIAQSNISKCLNSEQGTAGGYKWYYEKKSE